MKTGCVYIFHQKETPYFKIGMTETESAKTRFQEFCVYAPNGAEISLIIPTENPRSLEKELHKTFKHKRLAGEFFKLDKSDLEIIKSKHTTRKDQQIKNCLDLLYAHFLEKEKNNETAYSVIRYIRNILNQDIQYNATEKEKEIMSYIYSYMDSVGLEEIEVSPKDIKERFVINTPQRVVIEVLRNNSVSRPSGSKRYIPFSDPDNKKIVGRPYKIHRKYKSLNTP